jgi:alkylation response protein AidB-like acyl-CoA dehydrogenase
MPIVNEHHDALRMKLRDFAEQEVAPVAAELDEKEIFSVDLSHKMGDLGLFGITLPEKYGGAGLDTLSYIIAVEELARVDSSQAGIIASHNSLGISPIATFGTESQKEKYLPELTTGRKLWAFGLTEPTAGSDSQGTRTRAELENGDWVINGKKMFISNASTPISGGITVQAVTRESNGRKELSTILVEQDTAGFSVEKIHNKMMWRAIDTAKLSFDQCRVPEGNLLGERGMGSKIMLKTLDGGRLSIAAMGLGLAQGAFEAAISYAKNREQFGRPISKFQAIGFKLADMDVKIELARNTLYKACWLKDQGKPFGREAAIAKLYCSEIAREVADEALQIHGGYGLIKGATIERFYRDQRLLQIGEGTSEILRLIISRKLGI